MGKLSGFFDGKDESEDPILKELIEALATFPKQREESQRMRKEKEEREAEENKKKEN